MTRMCGSLPSTTAAWPKALAPCRLKTLPKSGILRKTCALNFGLHWTKNMLPDESLNQSIAQLSALPPRKRLEAFRAIQDPAERRQVAKALPFKEYDEMLTESMVDNLNRNVQAKLSSRKQPSRAA